MNEFILKTTVQDDVEFQIKNTKVFYLQNQINEQQSFIRDLKQIIDYNKQALSIHLSSKLDVQNVLAIVNEENKLLKEKVFKQQKKINQLEDQLLMDQQISNQQERFLRENITDMEEKVLELRTIIQDKEFTIQDLEKVKNIQIEEDVYQKYKEVVYPNQIIVDQQVRLQRVEHELMEFKKKAKKLEKENKENRNKWITNQNIIDYINRKRYLDNQKRNKSQDNISFKTYDEKELLQCDRKVDYCNDENIDLNMFQQNEQFKMYLIKLKTKLNNCKSMLEQEQRLTRKAKDVVVRMNGKLKELRYRNVGLQKSNNKYQQQNEILKQEIQYYKQYQNWYYKRQRIQKKSRGGVQEQKCVKKESEQLEGMIDKLDCIKLLENMEQEMLANFNIKNMNIAQKMKKNRSNSSVVDYKFKTNYVSFDVNQDISMIHKDSNNNNNISMNSVLFMD